jgi:hypothetical protein
MLLNFQPTINVPSGITAGEDSPELLYPGVGYVIKRLSVIERAQRDLALAEDIHQLEEWQAELETLPAPPKVKPGETVLVKDGETPPLLPTPEQATRRRYLSRKINSLMNAKIKGPIIRAGLVSVSGLAVNDQPMTIDQFLSLADEPLIDEAYIFCEGASRLAIEQLKNWQSAGISPAVEAGREKSTTAEPAESGVST